MIFSMMNNGEYADPVQKAKDMGYPQRSGPDVVIVGAGPVGLSLARLLGLRGHQILILERWAEPYPLPRAVHFDDEIGRVLQSMGLADQVRAISAAVPDHYEWRNAAGEPLLRIDWSGTGPCGWPTASFFSQPQLEELLATAATAMPNVTLRRGADVVGIEDRGEDVAVTFHAERQPETVNTRYVVGCDGANSFVREQMDVTVHDLGFYFDWLIVDTVPLDDVDWSPQNWQLCDPARPTTLVSGGPGRRRWEFMRLPGETREELNTAERAWQLLEPWGRTPENTELERHAVYTFAARWAEQWNRGRLLLAGDAAHLMPPFAGQGMCSGLRDAANLSWKLDRVLRGISDAALLDSYTSERSVHLQHAIAMSVELGRVICVLDDQQAAERDARMIAGEADPARVLPVSVLPVLGAGVTAESVDVPRLRGTLAPQFRVRCRGKDAPFDEAAGYGAVLLVLGGGTPAVDPGAADPDGLRILTVAADGDPDLDDSTGGWTRWLESHGVTAVLIRPDRYIFGAAAVPEAIPALIDQYHNRIHSTVGHTPAPWSPSAATAM
ncbi:bifunctional 3-(3-hydroxy-phenyl)propionate/3-hydroxycinnamic acid hydroxylase [Mycolicibacterium setense]|uniref:bifunctional 3-(3-hydroxy-phenyl)propionate/3-hydroxycinnamic acid hydroxylase MhpA n=2 Tax=Mycolicibacterium setense TaxID=431269 RepID=UPI003908A796